ncbi:MAG: hypothetical protein GY788_21025 [bacterium]|nr:hypothetical protein [bacterium]
MNHSESIQELAAALAKAQGAMSGATKSAENKHTSKKYADLASCWDACRGPLSANGLAVFQAVESMEDSVAVTTMLMHGESGQWLESTLVLPYDPQKGRSTVQAYGSAATYGRRYGLMAAVGLAPVEDDGQGAGRPAPRQQQPAPQEREQLTNPRAPRHHPTWSDDHRLFFQDLAKLGWDKGPSKDVNAELCLWLEWVRVTYPSERQWNRPSCADRTERRELLAWLESEQGRALWDVYRDEREGA